MRLTISNRHDKSDQEVVSAMPYGWRCVSVTNHFIVKLDIVKSVTANLALAFGLVLPRGSKVTRK
jgi:hypothetical protein